MPDRSVFLFLPKTKRRHPFHHTIFYILILRTCSELRQIECPIILLPVTRGACDVIDLARDTTSLSVLFIDVATDRVDGEPLDEENPLIYKSDKTGRGPLKETWIEDQEWDTLNGKQPIRTRYLGHVTSYQPIRDHYFLIRCLVLISLLSLSVCLSVFHSQYYDAHYIVPKCKFTLKYINICTIFIQFP
eukprot:sb/3471215/